MINAITCYHVGDSLKKKGGIASVLAFYSTHFSHIVKQKHISSYLGEARIFDYFYFLTALLQVIAICLIDKNPLFHIHTASKGSFLRKSIIASIIHLFKKTYIVHIHGGGFDAFIQKSSIKKRSAIMRYLNNAVMVVALSEKWKNFFQQYIPPVKIKVIYNPCVVHPYSKKIAERSAIQFLFLGRMNESKGVYDLINAVSLIKDARFMLDFYGDGEVGRLKKYCAERLGDCSKVGIHGWVRHDTINTLYENADVLILPSYTEGLPMSILEAMGWGMAIISTPIGGIPEVVTDGENGFLVNPGDVASLAEKMKILIENPQLLESMGARSRKAASNKFSAEIVEIKLRDLYRDTMKAVII